MLAWSKVLTKCMYVLIKRRCEDRRGPINLLSRKSTCACLSSSLGGSVPHIWELMFGMVMTWGYETLESVVVPRRASAWPWITA